MAASLSNVLALCVHLLNEIMMVRNFLSLKENDDLIFHSNNIFSAVTYCTGWT